MGSSLVHGSDDSGSISALYVKSPSFLAGTRSAYHPPRYTSFYVLGCLYITRFKKNANSGTFIVIRTFPGKATSIH